MNNLGIILFNKPLFHEGTDLSYLRNMKIINQINIHMNWEDERMTVMLEHISETIDESLMERIR